MKSNNRHLIRGLLGLLVPIALYANPESVPTSEISETKAPEELTVSQIKELDEIFGSHDEHLESLNATLRAKIDAAEAEYSRHLAGVSLPFVVIARS